MFSSSRYCFVYLVHDLYGFVQGDGFVPERSNYSVLDLVCNAFVFSVIHAIRCLQNKSVQIAQDIVLLPALATCE